MYHLVYVAKYRRIAISKKVDEVLREVCEEISKRFEMRFLEISTEGDYVHLLIQSLPSYSPARIVTKLKSITAREIFSSDQEVKSKLWGGEFWTDGYFVLTAGGHANKNVMRAYTEKHESTTEYTQMHKEEVSHKQLT